MKKIISILLVLCLSGCTALDLIDANNEYQTNDTYKNEYNYKETTTTEENQNQTKDGFTVKNSNQSKKNDTDNNQTKNGFQLTNKENKQLKSLYLFYYDQLSSTQKAVYEDL